jgi:nickel/cobalt transporter (NicO) family protein
MRRGQVLGAVVAGLVLSIALPAIALAHPLGNFTINTYSGIRVSATAVDLDIVLDEAEIPTFQERLRLDLDGDGELSDKEVDQAKGPECRNIVESIELSVAGSRQVPELRATGLSFPPGAGGLSTMRLVCELRATLATPSTGTTSISFANRIHNERIGWREIVVQGDGTTVESSGGPIASSSLSNRLTSYPTELLSQPLSETEIAFSASPGGAPLPALVAPDAELLPGVQPDPPDSSLPARANNASVAPPQAAIPGGVGADVPAVFRSVDLSPAVFLVALATAVALGAGHALTPGHGKTLMAAYLVGTRGTAIHAAGLGLSVTVSHTLGILALAVLVVGAQSALPPDVVIRFMPTIAALTIVGIGGWMLVSEIRRRRLPAAAHDHDHPHEHDHDHDHSNDSHEGEHSHGGVRHSHLPAPAAHITWRSLFLLGLAGGIIPSTNALLILLGTIAAGRTAFGIVLVVAFGIGMAVVLGGVGLVMVYARDRLERLPGSTRIGRLTSTAPLIASIAVLTLGLWLTTQAVAGRPAL